MNKYLIPVCDASNNAKCWIEVILSRSNSECQEKLMNKLLDKFDYLEEASTYNEFVRKADSANIIIGKITDIDEIV